MFVAINRKEQYVLARDAKKNSQFNCPGCHEPVILRVGDIKQQHFAHIVGAKCQTFSENEKAAHLSGKLQLAEQLATYGVVQIEAKLVAIQQRPDILLTIGDKQLAIEYQCSPISQKRLAERNEGYRRQNIDVIWILGETYFERHLSQKTILKFMTAHDQVVFYLPTQGHYIHRGHFIKKDFERVHYTEICDTMPFTVISKLSRQRPLDVKKQIYKLQNLLLQKRVSQQMISYFYNQNRLIILAPLWIHYGETFGLIIANWQWRLLAVCLIEKVGIGHKVRLRCIADKLFTYVAGNDRFRWRQVKKLLDSLQQQGYISLQGDYLCVLSELPWFISLAGKLDKVRKK